eukprot:gene364-379_t
MRNLQHLLASNNVLTHLGIHPPLLKPEDMWYKTQNEHTAAVEYSNIFTQEVFSDPSKYDGQGIQRLVYLHKYQVWHIAGRFGSSIFDPLHFGSSISDPSSKYYKKRKTWLSICQIHEWEPVLDLESGKLYYSNNVSGETQWQLPAEMDLLGHCTDLRVLDCGFNAIQSLPPSISRMKKLTALKIQHNRISILPYGISGLEALELLLCQDNELRQLPNSIVECKNIEEIYAQGNVLIKLPEGLGTLPRLTKLFVTANKLQALPYSLGFSQTLRELQLQENPLEDPPYSEVERGLPQVLWYLRQKALIEQRGMPPPMKFKHVGVAEEVNLNYVSRPEEFGDQMMGLREIPAELLKFTHLQQLRLDANTNIGEKLMFSTGFSSLKLLSLRACHLTTLPDISKNKLYDLPTGLKEFKELHILNAEDNYLDVIPAEIGEITSLEVLNFAKNRLEVLPFQLSELAHLRKLCLERNSLRDLPGGLRVLNIEDLRVSYNKLEWLPDDLLSDALGGSLVNFTCNQNNLM